MPNAAILDRLLAIAVRIVARRKGSPPSKVHNSGIGGAA
jgi:hypothetical protein